MSDRMITNDYQLRGREYEVWTDGTLTAGGYPNWWLSVGHKPGWVITETDFDPVLTDKEITAISEYVYDSVVLGDDP